MRRSTKRATAWLFALACAVGAGSVASLADSVSIGPSRDNTIYEESSDFSNGAGQHLFGGKTGSFHARRALIAFDVAGSIPAGSTVTEATLTLYCSRTPNVGVLDDHEFSLHRVLADWGEGSADAPGAEGPGTAAGPGDATWTHRFYDTVSWTTAGGDFVVSPSAALFVGSNGYYDWGSTSAMAADVQSWLDDPSSNFGWILVGDEFDLKTARRFDSKDNPTAARRPVLTVEFTPAPAAAGAVPDGDDVAGNPLVVAKAAPGEITLSWSDSCRTSDDDYEVYEGVLGAFTGHAIVACSTGGATTFSLGSFAAPGTYYLVVPSDGEVEGSYGRDSLDAERPPAATACLSQSMLAPVCPN